MKVDIISGFLGAGKTTIIKKLIDSDLKNEKIMVIENEFGEVSIDGLILNKYGINIKEINSGCICCNLTKDFKESIKDIKEAFNPDRIIIEPSGVSKLSDIIKSLKETNLVEINNLITVVDAVNFKTYLENFNEFYKDQLLKASTIIINDRVNKDSKLINAVEEEIKKINKHCNIITKKDNEFDGNYILSVAEKDLNKKDEKKIFMKTAGIGSMRKVVKEHHKDDFNNLTLKTDKVFNKSVLQKLFTTKIKSGYCGNILRAKGMIELDNSKWIEFHYTPGFFNIYESEKQPKGIMVFIGDNINKESLKELFD